MSSKSIRISSLQHQTPARTRTSRSSSTMHKLSRCLQSRRMIIFRPRQTPYSTQPHTPSPSHTPSKPPPIPPPNPSLPSFNLFSLLRTSRPAVRYTVYLGLGLMATVESIFWFHVLKAKFFPAQEEEERAKANEFLGRVGEAVKGARGNWIRNYGAYYEGYVWGVGER